MSGPQETTGAGERRQSATVFVPATIGNVGPGFDVLGLAIAGLGDVIRVDLVDEEPQEVVVKGRDAAHVPRDPRENCASIAACQVCQALGVAGYPLVTIDRSLPLSGGLGASAASSVGGGLAAYLAFRGSVDGNEPHKCILAAALAGEAAVAGKHLDNIAPCLLGGLTIVCGVEPPKLMSVPLTRDYFAALVTPDIKIRTADARRVLPDASKTKEWVQQMANACTLVTAMHVGDLAGIRDGLRDGFCEPRRASLIPGFDKVKGAALAQGALGCSISGAGPTVFALCETESIASKCAEAMASAFEPLACTTHVGAIDEQGARPIHKEPS